MEMVNCYRIPYVILPIIIIEYAGKFYSFGPTARSFQGIWNEVKSNLDSLNELTLDPPEIEEIKQYFEESLEGLV